MNYIVNPHSLPSRCAEAVLQLLFPMSIYCLCCGKPVDSSRSYSICDHCIHHITWGKIYIDLEAEAESLGRPARLDSAVACMKYGLYERRLIFDLKYDGRTYVARAIGRIMADRLTCEPDCFAETTENGGKKLSQNTGDLSDCRPDYIVPVPVHRDREKVRGFNQAEKIALYLSKYLEIPMLPHALIRHRRTAAQRALSMEDRYFNLEGAFSVNPNDEKKVRGKRILLLDDVYTTGATAHCCGAVLKESGAKTVDFISLATGNDFARGMEMKSPDLLP